MNLLNLVFTHLHVAGDTLAFRKGFGDRLHGLLETWRERQFGQVVDDSNTTIYPLMQVRRAELPKIAFHFPAGQAIRHPAG